MLAECCWSVVVARFYYFISLLSYCEYGGLVNPIVVDMTDERLSNDRLAMTYLKLAGYINNTFSNYIINENSAYL